MLEKTLERPLGCKEIQPVHPKRDQSWVFIGRTDVEAEIPILWPPDGKNWLTGKDPDAGRDWGQEEKGTTEDEMAGWHHRFDRHGFGWTPGVGDGQGGLVCCDTWGHKESDMTERLNWTPKSELSLRALWSIYNLKLFTSGHAKLFGCAPVWKAFNLLQVICNCLCPLSAICICFFFLFFFPEIKCWNNISSSGNMLPT